MPTITVSSRHNGYASSYRSYIHFEIYCDSDARATPVLVRALCLCLVNDDERR